VKVGSCRSYAPKGWYEDLTLPKIRSLPATIPWLVAILGHNTTAHGQQAARGARARIGSMMPSFERPGRIQLAHVEAASAAFSAKRY
jgi:hypothetical protein